jgi:hypothetical protein
MKFRVTQPKTVYGRYYGLNEIVDIHDGSPGDSSVSRSLARLYKWEPVSGDPKPLTKPDLYALAEKRGVEVPAKATKKELLELLGES